MKEVTARSIAYETLAAVEDKEAYANLVLPSLLNRTSLSERDCAFSTELAYGTLRMQGFYDAILRVLTGEKWERLDLEVRRVLRLGVHQLLTLGQPPHAVVNESVLLSRRVGAGRASGLVNGVLRRVSEASITEWRERVLAPLEGSERLAVEYSHPSWIVEEFQRSLAHAGRASELEKLLAADNINAAPTLVALPGLSALAAEPERLSPLAHSSRRGMLRNLTPGLRVQDEGSQLAALCLTRVEKIVPGEDWIDMCAGPGGKASLLAAEARLAGAHLVANEVSPHRADLVRKALQREGLEVEVTQRDGRNISQTGHRGRFHRVLLDVPCSGLGALRRRPEARWRKSPADLAGLTQLQRDLLRSGLELLAPGGVLAYVTCSPALYETVAIVNEVVPDYPEIHALDTSATLDRIAGRPVRAGVSTGLGGSAIQLWPHIHDTDAMFVQLLQRDAHSVEL